MLYNAGIKNELSSSEVNKSEIGASKERIEERDEGCALCFGAGRGGGGG